MFDNNIFVLQSIYLSISIPDCVLVVRLSLPGRQLLLVVLGHVDLAPLLPWLELDLLLLVRGVQGDLVDAVDEGVPVQFPRRVLLTPVRGPVHTRG